jgi:GNAT superfamily N-acetyltransferase
VSLRKPVATGCYAGRPGSARYRLFRRGLGGVHPAGTGHFFAIKGNKLSNQDLNIATRPATADDREWLIELRVATMDVHLHAAGIKVTHREHQARVDQDFDQIRIVCLDSNRVGMIKAIRVEQPWRLVQIQILAAHQALGIGTRLVTELLREADRADVPVELNVLKVNPARHLYHRLGFATVADRDSALTMRYISGSGQVD